MTKKQHPKFVDSVRFAFAGIQRVWSSERNFRSHVVIAVLICLLGLYFQLSRMEWMILLLVIASVLITEMINTAIEYTIDRISYERHPLAKLAKDVAAGAVILSVVFSIIIGILLFYPHILTIFI